LYRIWGPCLRNACAAAGLMLVVVAGRGLAQSTTQNPDQGTIDESQFIGENWVQTYPDYSYLDGCHTGYRAFTFTADHYFVFNLKVHGSWRVSSIGNTLDLTVLSGPTPSVLQLIYNNGSTLRPNIATNAPTTVQSNPANGTFQFRRSDLFQRCAN
jgi:hypothetical protein